MRGLQANTSKAYKIFHDPSLLDPIVICTAPPYISHLGNSILRSILPPFVPYTRILYAHQSLDPLLSMKITVTYGTHILQTADDHSESLAKLPGCSRTFFPCLTASMPSTASPITTCRRSSYNGYHVASLCMEVTPRRSCVPVNNATVTCRGDTVLQ
jgi:hypothetical protein